MKTHLRRVYQKLDLHRQGELVALLGSWRPDKESACGKVTYNAGDSWTEGTKLHDVVNNSSADAHFVITYIVAKGVNKRTDEPAPRCAAALGLR